MMRVFATIGVLTAGLAVAAWFVLDSSSPQMHRASPASPALPADSQTRAAPEGRFYRLPRPSLDLAWSAPVGLDRAALAPKPAGPKMPAVQITRVRVPAPVDVDFADMDLAYPGAHTPDNVAPPPDRDARQAMSQQLNPNIDEWRPRSDDDELFNNNTGLRGFMTQSWINDNVGIQGGLAIPSERTRDENQSLSDQMAVGMGVLFAF